MLQEWVERAGRRVPEIDAAFTSRQTRPLLTYQAGSSHWTVNIALPEDATAVQYRLGDRGGFSRAELNLSGDGKTARAAAFTIDHPRLIRIDNSGPLGQGAAALLAVLQGQSG